MTSNPERRRHAILTLFGYVIIVYAGLTALRRDAWPFVTHGILFHRVDSSQPFSSLRLIAIDAQNHAWRVPSDAWSPVSERTLQEWILLFFRRAGRAHQQAILRFLLERAESARRRSVTGQRIGHEKWLGSFAAPQWFSPLPNPAVGPSRYVAIRIDLVTTVPAKRLMSPAESSQVFAEFHE